MAGESFEYAVCGAGPAGAMAALALAARGRSVALVHWAPRAEKPCGGGVPARGMARYGALLDGVPRNEARAVRVVGPARDEAEVELTTPLSIFARRELDDALRRRAERAGAQRIDARVVALARTSDGFELELRRRADGPIERARARFVVAADGAAGLVRRRLLELAGVAAPGPEQFSRSFTTYPVIGPSAKSAVDSSSASSRARADVLELAWSRGVDGYGWVFPRSDHASIGWCAQGTRGSETIQGFGERGVGALIPSFRGEVAARAPVEGPGFALVGDAAGAVDPITREGIHHAMATGAALGECDPRSRPGRYCAWYDAELRPELVRAAALAPTFFAPRFLTTMVRALARSAALRDVFRDLVAGTQSYSRLRQRLLRALPRSLPSLCAALVAPAKLARR